ncbi:MAG: Hpt domain-containing protein [Eubacteriales bacterium]|nr:Hpt domain-containing protein [Eubacteriales bacterium]
MGNTSLKEIYIQLEGHYEKMLKRLRRETVIREFLEDFLEDEEFCKLEKAMEMQDDAAAFQAAHALKGITANMEFGFFAHSVSALTESLRYGRTPETEELYETVKRDYYRTLRIIKGEDEESRTLRYTHD